MSGVVRDQLGQPITDQLGQPITDQTWVPGPGPGPQRPNRPSVTMAMVAGETLTLQASAFSHPGGFGHAASQWQVRLAGGSWNAPLYDSGQSSDLTTHEVDTSGWGPGIYEARVRYLDDAPDN